MRPRIGDERGASAPGHAQARGQLQARSWAVAVTYEHVLHVRLARHRCGDASRARPTPPSFLREAHSAARATGETVCSVATGACLIVIAPRGPLSRASTGAAVRPPAAPALDAESSCVERAACGRAATREWRAVNGARRAKRGRCFVPPASRKRHMCSAWRRVGICPTDLTLSCEGLQVRRG